MESRQHLVKLSSDLILGSCLACVCELEVVYICRLEGWEILGLDNALGELIVPFLMAGSRFDLVIFDCDGVLVDSEPINNRAHAQVLSDCGYLITENELLARFCGMSDAEMLHIIEQEWGRALPPFYAQRVGSMIKDGLNQSLVAIAGVGEAIDSVRLPVCVASSSVPELIRRKLDLTSLLARFGDNIFSATMVARGKPAPDLFLYAAAQLGAAPDRCVVIEDSLPGIEAGGRRRNDRDRVLRREPLRRRAWGRFTGRRRNAGL
jgi:HAD superfamily hydrolase (TIGR01509 family)